MKTWLRAISALLIIGVAMMVLPPTDVHGVEIVWEVVGNAGFSTSTTGITGMAIDSSGTPYIAYADQDNSNKVTVMKYNGTTWVPVGNPGFSANRVEYVTIAIDSSGTPYVAYSDAANANKATVMKYNGTTWVPVGSMGFSMGEILDTSMAIDNTGIPYVAYRDVVNGYKVTVMKYNGTIWVPVGSMGFSAISARYLNMTLASDGTPYVTYSSTSNGFKLTVMRYNGVIWELVGVEGFSAASAYSPTIAIDSLGSPYVAYANGSNGNKATVMKYNGAAWVTAGNAGFSTDAAYFPAVAIDKNDLVYVAYKDATKSHKVTVMKYNGTTWETMGSTGFSGAAYYNVSLVVDNGGIPYVAYIDTDVDHKVTVMKAVSVIPANTVIATTYTSSPTAGEENEIALTVKNSIGNTDYSFFGEKEVTISGLRQAPNGSYGSFNGVDLTGPSQTINVFFDNGAAYPMLRLNSAETQTIGFSIDGVTIGNTNNLTITPSAGNVSTMELTTDITAPLVTGGQFAQQPVITLKDDYGNICTGDSTTQVTVSKRDTGNWTLTGTKTRTASNGIVTYTDIGADNAAQVDHAQLAFNAAALPEVTSTTVTLPAPPPPGAPFLRSAAAGDGHVNLTWDSVAGSTGYKVYTSTSPGVYTSPTASVADSVYSYDVTSLVNGTTYYFVVKATNPGGDSPDSNQISATPQVSAPSAPAGVTAAGGNAKVTLNWNSVSEAAEYKIFQSTVSGSYGTPRATVTGSVYNYEATGLTNGTTYYFVIKAVNAGGDSPNSAEVSATPSAPSGSNSSQGSNSSSTATTTTTEENGTPAVAAITTITAAGGNTVTTVTIDDKKVQEELQREGHNAVITIPVNNHADTVIGRLNGQTVKSMEGKDAVLEIKTGNITYILPASEINIDDVLSQFGSQGELKDIAIDIRISVPPQDTARIVQEAANNGNYQLIVKPIEFEITCTSGNKTVQVSKFNGYVERLVAIPDGVDPGRITTGVVLNTDGTFSHVPTAIIQINGKYYSKIKSLTNSVYSVIWNPRIFIDVENHWAKDAVNDMGARLIVNGVDKDRFEPDRDITRAEFAAIIVKALGLMRSGAGEDVFKDVKKETWYYDAVSIAYEYGIISGDGKSEFAPENKITREQAMAMVSRAMKITGLYVQFKDGEAENLISSYKDSREASGWAKDFIAACIKAEVVSGSSGKTIAPKENITRSEVAVIVKRLLQKSGLTQ